MCRSMVDMQSATAEISEEKTKELECGSLANLMAALTDIGGALCSTPQILGWLEFRTFGISSSYPEVDCTDTLYVPKVIVPILTFNVPKLDVPKKRTESVCTEIFPYRKRPTPTYWTLNESHVVRCGN